MSIQVLIRYKSMYEENVIEDLAQVIESRNPQIKVRRDEIKQIGYGVTFWEVVYIFILAEVSKTLISEITKASIKWAKDRFKRESINRPKYISIFGEEGVPVKAFLVSRPKEVEDKTEYAIAQHISRYIAKPFPVENIPPKAKPPAKRKASAKKTPAKKRASKAKNTRK